MKNDDKNCIIYVGSNDVLLLRYQKGDIHILWQVLMQIYIKRTCKIDKSVSDKLEKFIADTKLSKTATVEKALEEYINKYNKTGKI